MQQLIKSLISHCQTQHLLKKNFAEEVKTEGMPKNHFVSHRNNFRIRFFFSHNIYPCIHAATIASNNKHQTIQQTPNYRNIFPFLGKGGTMVTCHVNLLHCWHAGQYCKKDWQMIKHKIPPKILLASFIISKFCKCFKPKSN